MDKFKNICVNCILISLGIALFLLYLRLTSPELIVSLNSGIVNLILKLLDNVIGKDAFISIVIAAISILVMGKKKHKTSVDK